MAPDSANKTGLQGPRRDSHPLQTGFLKKRIEEELILVLLKPVLFKQPLEETEKKSMDSCPSSNAYGLRP
jgi:hypothetical protein